MKQYHYLVAGLPDIRLDDNKIPISISELRSEVSDALSESDLEQVNLFFRKYDNQNLLGYLADKDASYNALGALTSDDFEGVIQALKEEENPNLEGIPTYLKSFVSEIVNEVETGALSLEDRLNSLYYSEAIQASNSFIREWYQFNLNVRNVLVALNCRAFDKEVDNYIVGSNEVAELLKSNTSRDFGLPVIFPWFDQVARIYDEKDFVKQEKMLDVLFWNFLEEESFFHYFSVERIFVYLQQLEIIERWISLDPEKGKEKFQTLINDMRGKVSFSSEFDV